MPSNRVRLVSCCAALFLLVVDAIALPDASAISVQTAARPRHGVVRACGRALCDDEGPWPALGATLFWGAWGYKFDRARLEQHLQFLADHHFDYIRVLGEVGGPNWNDRQIDPRWPDYDRVVSALTDLAYQKYGLRVEWCLFGGVDFSTTPALRAARIDRFARAMVGREHAVLLTEIANEGWQNGFPHPAGTAELRTLATRLGTALAAAGAKPLLRAITSPAGPDVYGSQDRHAPFRLTYDGASAEVGTVHTGRDRKGDGWALVREVVDYRGLPGMPAVVSNDEPIGPGSSGTPENDPLLLVSQAIASYLSGMAAYTYHTNAGIYGGGLRQIGPQTGQPRPQRDLWSFPRAREIAAGFKAMRTYIPADIASWSFSDTNAKGQPFEGTTGAVAMFSAVKDARFVAFPFGLQGRPSFKATRAMTFTVIHPLTGATLRTGVLTAGQALTLGAEPQAVVIVGSFK
jgi:hypothetical protein